LYLPGEAHRLRHVVHFQPAAEAASEILAVNLHLLLRQSRDRGRGFLRADGYWEDGYGGRKVGVDASARLGIRRAFEIEGRLTGYEWRADATGDAARSPNDAGVVFGAQAGGRWQLGRGVKLHLLAEDNVGTFYSSAFRGLAVVEVDASL